MTHYDVAQVRGGEVNPVVYQPALWVGRWGGGGRVSDLTFLKGTNPALKKPSNIPEIYAKMFGRFH